MRRVRVLLASLLLGCAGVGSRTGLPPTDRHKSVVRAALEPVIPRAVETAVRDAAPPGAIPEFLGQGCVGSSGEQEWYVDVRYVRADGAALAVNARHFDTVMTAVRNAAWHAVKVDGVEAVGPAGSPSSDALSARGKHVGKPVAFVLQYFRQDFAVQGEVVGIVGPSLRQPGYTTVCVVQTEWRAR